MRALRVLLATLVLTLAAPSVAALAAQRDLPRIIEGRLAAFSGGAAIVVADPLGDATLYERNADEEIVAASLYKLGILLEVERRVEAGELSYDDTITLAWQDLWEGSFVEAGTTLSVDEALELMITRSDNGTAHAFLRVFGAAAVDETLAALGVQPFHVDGGDGDNYASARAVSTFFAKLGRRELVSSATSDRMLRRLARQQVSDRLPAHLPSGTVVAHKTGNLGFVTHDAGLVFGPSGSPVVVVAMTWDSTEEEATVLIRDIGELVYAHAFAPSLRAGLAVARPAPRVTVGSALVQTLRVRNLGSQAWSDDAVRFVWEMRDARGGVVAGSPEPLRVGHVAPGGVAEIPLVLAVPSAGEYLVRIAFTDDVAASAVTFSVRARLPSLAVLPASALFAGPLTRLRR